MNDRPVYVTEEGKADLEQELNRLREVERPRVIDRLHEVKSGGDWMENTEQMMFEDELAFVDRRIQELEDMLADHLIIQPDQDRTVVNIGDTVEIEGEDGEFETYKIVGVAEASPADGLISNESPMGRALLSRKVGEKITVVAPAGELQFTIIALK
ncbi:MAG: transcription elongation factor GreA [Chloroflexota bacterium]|jgi:transcription elongation factor GreA